MADKDKDSGDEEELTIAEDAVVNKYKMAGEMAKGIGYISYFFLNLHV